MKSEQNEGQRILTSFQEHFKWSGGAVGVGPAGIFCDYELVVLGPVEPRLWSAVRPARVSNKRYSSVCHKMGAKRKGAVQSMFDGNDC